MLATIVEKGSVALSLWGCGRLLEFGSNGAIRLLGFEYMVAKMEMLACFVVHKKTGKVKQLDERGFGVVDE